MSVSGVETCAVTIFAACDLCRQAVKWNASERARAVVRLQQAPLSSLPGAVKIAGTVEKVRRAKGLGGVAGRVVLDQTVGAGAVTGALTDVFVFEPNNSNCLFWFEILFMLKFSKIKNHFY